MAIPSGEIPISAGEVASSAPAEPDARHRLWLFRRLPDEIPSSTEEMAISAGEMASGQYHERQQLWRCGRHALNNHLPPSPAISHHLRTCTHLPICRHALNNLLGHAAFTSSDLDAISVELGAISAAVFPSLTLEHRWPLLGHLPAIPLISLAHLSPSRTPTSLLPPRLPSPAPACSPSPSPAPAPAPSPSPGNYDANVLLSALSRKHLVGQWWAISL